MASGDTLLVFTPNANNPPASSAATFDTRNDHLVLDFDATTDADEAAIFPGVLPAAYAGGGLTVTLVWMASTAETGNVIWDAFVERHAANSTDLDTDDFTASPQTSGVQGAPATSGLLVYSNITFASGSEMDSLAAKESFRLKIVRDTTSLLDTMAGDAELLRVVVAET